MVATIYGVIPRPSLAIRLLAADINMSPLMFTDVHFINDFS